MHRNIVDERKRAVHGIRRDKISVFEHRLAEKIFPVEAVHHHDFRIGILLQNMFFQNARRGNVSRAGREVKKQKFSPCHHNHLANKRILQKVKNNC